MKDSKKDSNEGCIPLPSPDKCIEDLRDDGFHPEAALVARMKAELEWISHNACQTSRLECLEHAKVGLGLQ